jgi:hypothetical protein
LSQGQEAFLEGHVYAFDRLGGVPVEQIRYDNLKPAVSRVLFGRTRVESQRWVAFRSTYGFDPFYCQPGHEGSHEKGGVEGEGGRFRRNHCVPMPKVDSIAELNALLEAWDGADDARRVGNRTKSVGHDWALERPVLRPLPDEPFDTALTLTPRVDRYAQVMMRCCQYSVPARFIGHLVRVRLSSTMAAEFIVVGSGAAALFGSEREDRRRAHPAPAGGYKWRASRGASAGAGHCIAEATQADRYLRLRCRARRRIVPVGYLRDHPR